MKKLVVALLALSSFEIFAYGVGYTSHPLQKNKRIVTTELGGIASTGGGFGIQGRYTQKLSTQLTFDAGAGLAGGSYKSRFFAGADYEILPDYMNQPRTSVKTIIERASEFEKTRTKLVLSPTVSKGFSFWGKEGFPFVSMPVGLSLQSDDSTYTTTASLNFGVTGQVPIRDYNHLLANIETQISLKDSYSAIMFGVTYPLP